MDEYYIEGGFPVKGTVKASGNKNAALPCIAAAVLTDKPVTLKNLPEIEDVAVMFDIFKSFGGTVTKRAQNEYTLQLKEVTGCEIPPLLSSLRGHCLHATVKFPCRLLAVMLLVGVDSILTFWH